jgi:hypothetical protein
MFLFQILIVGIHPRLLDPERDNIIDIFMLLVAGIHQQSTPSVPRSQQSNSSIIDIFVTSTDCLFTIAHTKYKPIKSMYVRGSECPGMKRVISI